MAACLARADQDFVVLEVGRLQQDQRAIRQLPACDADIGELRRYPAFAVARQQGLIDLEPPSGPEQTVTVKVDPSAYSRVDVTEAGTIQMEV